MAKIHKLTKGNAIIYPLSVTDAIVDPTTRKSVTRLLSELASALAGKANTSALDLLVNNGGYNSVSKKIELKHGSTVLAEIDAAAFIKDGMVSNVTISNGYLVISFNTDAGQSPISIPISDIFNSSNYYTKTQTDSLLAGKYAKPQSGIPSSDMSSAVQISLGKAGTAYQKPSSGIPATDLAQGVIPDVSQFITKSVDDLVNYYLKSETYTKAEVQALIAAINQFHYEVYPTLASVTDPQSNVLYLIGPTGSGTDMYEEYVYANGNFVKIGDTSIDLSGYVTTEALNTALASYSTTTEMQQAISTALASYYTRTETDALLGGKQDTLTFDNVPTSGSDNPVKSGGVYDAIGEVDAKFDDHAKIDGAYEGMLAGNAMNLVDTTGTPVLREFVFSKSGGSEQIATGTALIKCLRGNTIVWNQLVRNGNFADGTTGWAANNSSTSLSVANNELTITQTGDSHLSVYQIVNHALDHKYLGLIKAKASSSLKMTWRMYTSGGILADFATSKTISTSYETYSNIITVSSGGSGTYNRIYISLIDGSQNDVLYIKDVRIFDLTLMFGAGNEPSTVAEFEALFPLNYYAYNAGQLLSFSGDSIKTTGFNQLNLNRGTEYDTNTSPEDGGAAYLNEDYIIKGYAMNGYVRSANIDSYSILNNILKVKTSTNQPSNNYGIGMPIKILGGSSYYLHLEKSLSGSSVVYTFLDVSGNLISYGNNDLSNASVNTPEEAAWIVLTFRPGAVDTEATFSNISFNLSDTSKNGTYEPYVVNTKDISFYKSIKDGQGNTLFPYGLLSAGSVYDEVTENKAIKRVGVVDLGSLTYDSYNTTYKRFGGNGVVGCINKSNVVPNAICSLYSPKEGGKVGETTYGSYDMTFGFSNTAGKIIIANYAYTDPATFKTAMNGVMLYYELAEPIEVDIEEQNLAYQVDGGGTEQLLSENTSTPTTTPARFDVNYGLDAMATLKNLQKNYLAQTDLDRMLTAEGYTYTKTWDATNNQWNFTISGNSKYDNKAESANIGYYECEAAAGSTKSFTAEGYTLAAGGCVKVKMTNRNTQASCKMNINSTGDKPLWYNGALATAKNTWLAGETLLVYYDGSVYQSYGLNVPDLTPISRSMWVSRNHYFDSTYKYVNYENYDCVAIPIQYGSKRIRLSGFANLNRLRFWDSVSIFDGTAHEPLLGYSSASNSLWYELPKGTVMAVINISKSSDAYIDYADYLVEFDQDFLGLWTDKTITSNQIIDYTSLSNFHSASGNWVSHVSARCTQMIPVTAGQAISYNRLLVYSKSSSGQTLNQGSFYGAFDKNGKLIRTVNFIGTYTDSTNTYITGTFNVLDNTDVAGIKIVLKSSNASFDDYLGTTFACYGDTLLTEDTFAESGNGTFYFPDELMERIYENSNNLKNIKILSIGNSYSQDAFSYVPYIMRSICPNVKLTFGLAIHGGATLQHHLGWFTNQEAEYTYYKYTPTIDNGSDVAWENKGSKTGQQIVADEDWDMIILQQESGSQPDWTTYQPYLNQLIDFLQGIMTHDVRFAWMQVQCRDFTATHDTTWQGIITATQNVMNQTVIQDLIPVGTAIENARTTNLDLIGSDTHMNYNNHLQEGIGCQIAAYMAMMKFIEIFDLGGKSIMFDTSRMTAAYLADKDIPGANGTSVGVTDYNCYAGQMSAIMASKTPYVVSDMVTLGLVDNSKIVTT